MPFKCWIGGFPEVYYSLLPQSKDFDFKKSFNLYSREYLLHLLQD
jgi:hypothetical protein